MLTIDNHLRTPAAIADRLFPQSGNSPVSFIDNCYRRYALAVATYYADQPLVGTPPCSLANVVTTLLKGDQRQVLYMVRTYPPSAALAQDLLVHLHEGVQFQVYHVLGGLQQQLRAYPSNWWAQQVVGHFLLRFLPERGTREYAKPFPVLMGYWVEKPLYAAPSRS